MESKKGIDGKMSRSTIDSSILFSPGNIIKNSIQRNVGNPKEVIVEAGNRIGDKVQGETISFFGNSNFSRSISNSETAYDEYEEDKDYVRWQLPKMKKLPTLSSLVRFRYVDYLSRKEL